ncbi:MAG TPA: serine/threonine-protein kinase [Kofleriaceae bacterium]
MRLGDDRYRSSGEPNAMVGTQVGPFTILCPLGEGGTGRVYLAEHAVLKTRRAVKLLPAPLAQDALAVRRFVHEARTVAQLHHRNLIQVHDVGELASGAWFVVLDYLHGRTLARLMAGHAGPMPADLIVHLVCQIANGLQVVHDHQLVHRDLTSDDVFLISREGDPYHVVLLDVGISPVTRTISANSANSTIGAIAYRSPEQLRTGRASPASDVFALGVIAYQMSTGGWFPHQYGESRAGYAALPATELHHRHRSAPVDPRERSPGLPAAWADLLLAAVSADPARRPASARAFALGLARALPAAPGALSGLAIVRTHARELLEVGAGAGSDAGSNGSDAGPAADANAGGGAGLDAAATPRPGAPCDIGSRYQLGEPLGAGGMAEVFSATMIGAEGFARRVAIKRVLSGLSRTSAFAAMFVAEARIASRLAHPNIVSVLDFARDAEDRLYLVMEYVDGPDLASLLATGAIGPSLAIFVAVEMLRALGYAHEVELSGPAASGDGGALGGLGAEIGDAGELGGRSARRARGVIHRDVSPQNLLLGYEGAVKLSDFGLARVRAASGHVRSDVVRGKPSYMSPEQVSGAPLDGRADLFAAGVMLWEMLADRPLFTGTAKEITAQVLFKDIARPSSLRSAVPADLEAVAMTLLAYDRRDRYPTAGAAIQALLACADAPRDGRGELVQVLAARFRSASGASGAGAPRRGETAGSPRALRAGQGTVSAPPSAPAVAAAVHGAAPAGDARLTAPLSLVVLGALTARAARRRRHGRARPGHPFLVARAGVVGAQRRDRPRHRRRRLATAF